MTTIIIVQPIAAPNGNLFHGQKQEVLEHVRSNKKKSNILVTLYIKQAFFETK